MDKNKLEKECMGIVNQLFDLAEVPVEKRQSINDKADEYLQEQFLRLFAVSGSAIRPPLGLIPKKFHDERVKLERFNEVCGAIARYYDAGLKINIEWIEEYNELVESVG